MGLRDRVANDPISNNHRRHIVDRLLLLQLEPAQADEARELLFDPDVTASSLSRAIAAEYGVKISEKSIRDWRRDHGPERSH